MSYHRLLYSARNVPWIERNDLKRVWLCVFQSVLLCLLIQGGITSAQAAEVGPTSLENSQWMSFEHYKDLTSRKAGKILSDPLAEPDADVTTPPTAHVQDNGQTTAQPSPDINTASSAPATTAPQRTLNLPSMPASPKGFSVPVSSTEDETAAALPVMDDKIAPDIHLANENWESPSNHAANGEEGDESTSPKVRLSYLPSAKVTPTASPDHVSVMALDHAIVRQLAAQAGVKKTKDDVKKSPEERAACAAIDAYKKQQLDAIQGDRQTLKALQDAIASLGLQKELGFISDNHGSLNASAMQTGGLDTPVTTKLR